ncbi:ATP-binding cassette domain-containing protein [Flocculibacter collagenilyticus]|uniref:ATP-binding cassette domain-containing protein n=1 Tax=Flocculibacter collagenilyticus TaxID=2744479 RepID=UPI0018F6F9D7|nr:ATP-binding cassette domain-containing protein [Flocculibacter collagenilyticus]
MNHFLEVKSLSKDYYYSKGFLNKKVVKAVLPTSFVLEKGETIAIVGETGSGKSSLAKIISGADKPTSGDVFLEGKALSSSKRAKWARNIRLIFQDANKSLNPSLTVGKTLSEVLKLNTKLNAVERKEKIKETLLTVGLLSDHRTFYPHMFSGGQLQRVALARALILDPQVLVLDEALASLDPSVRAQIINLLLDLQEKKNLSYILVTHQLGLVKHISDKVLVLHEGETIEQGVTETVFACPQHKYTQRLLTSQNY